MKLTYDPEANAAYIYLRDKQGDLETVTITDDFFVDIDETGSVCGIELLNANDQLVSGEDGKLTLENLVSGEEIALKVA